MFSCEFCEIFKNTFSYRTPLVAASVGKDLVYKMMTILIFKYLKRFYINILFWKKTMENFRYIQKQSSGGVLWKRCS